MYMYMQLYVRRGASVFRDELEWDLASATSSTHIYTTEVRVRCIGGGGVRRGVAWRRAVLWLC